MFTYLNVSEPVRLVVPRMHLDEKDQENLWVILCEVIRILNKIQDLASRPEHLMYNALHLKKYQRLPHVCQEMSTLEQRNLRDISF